MAEESYSIALRLRRVTIEDAYVSVLVTDAIIKQHEDGSGRIDFERFVASAVALGSNPLVEWQVENSFIEPHPTQGPQPDNSQLLDSIDIR